MASLCLLAAALLTVSGLYADEPIRVLSFNVRNSLAQDGENDWVKRKDFLGGIITGGNYDFIGTQETVLHPEQEQNQLVFIAEKLPTHGFLGRSREKNPDIGEAVVIFYRKTRWQIDDSDQETFWLSDTPDVAGSKTDPQAGCPRTVTAALFHEIREGQPTGRKLYVGNTHYDHKSESARQRGARLLMRKIAERRNKDVPVIVMGDLNCGEKSPAVKYMLGDPMVLDKEEHIPPYKLLSTFRSIHPDATEVGTFNNFIAPGKEKIDYILISPVLKTLSSEIIRDQFEGRYPSDHFPINATIAW